MRLFGISVAVAAALVATGCGFDSGTDLDLGSSFGAAPGPDAGEPPGDQPPGDQPPGDQPPGDQPPGDPPPGDGGDEGEHVVSLRIDEPFTVAGWSEGLNDILAADCEQGYLVGFAGDIDDDYGFLGVRGICADLIVENGQLAWQQVGVTERLGDEEDDEQEISVCDSGELLTGLVIYDASLNSATGMAAICSPVTLSGVNVTVGEPAEGSRIGDTSDYRIVAPCETGAAATRLAADSDWDGFGALGIRCGEIVPVTAP